MKIGGADARGKIVFVGKMTLDGFVCDVRRGPLVNALFASMF
jgi:hypothetical protein